MDRAALPTVLVTGATGRVGTLLRAAWSQEPPSRFVPVWQHRGIGTRHGWLRWDMLGEPCPILPQPPAVIVNLAGVTGSGPGLSRNLALAHGRPSRRATAGVPPCLPRLVRRCLWPRPAGGPAG